MLFSVFAEATQGFDAHFTDVTLGFAVNRLKSVSHVDLMAVTA